MLNNLLPHFPAPYLPSEQQKELLKKIQSAFSRGVKFVIANAPTGSGKSFLPKTIGNASNKASREYADLISSYASFKQNQFGEFLHEADHSKITPHGAFVLTVTKTLQDQYANLFDNTIVVKGKSNYQCDIDDQLTVDIAPCVLKSGIKEVCWQTNRCPYYNARNYSLVSQFAVLNYKMFLSLPGHVKYRQVIICDEASELEDELVTRFSADISYKALAHNGIDDIEPLLSDDYAIVRPWLTDLVTAVRSRKDQLTSFLAKKDRKFTQSDRAKLSYVTNLHASLGIVDENWATCEYVVDRTAEKVNLAPLKVDAISNSIFGFADKVLLMSATIIDHKHFAKTLGITDYEYIEAESVFDPAKSPIKVNKDYKLNYANTKELLPRIAKDVKAISEHHKADKGVVHTHSQQICDAIRKELGQDTRFLFRNDTQRNEHILEDHAASTDPTVLVSPSLTHGIDLKDDLARFQIVVKAPYPPLGTKRIKRLFDLDKTWYENKMLNTLVQTCGRATRGVDDHSVTYILDGNIGNILVRCKDRLPKHFLLRFA